MIETKRLRIYPASQTQMEEAAAAEHDPELKAAYAQMLDGCLRHPDGWEWYAMWPIELRDGTRIGDLCFKGLGANGVTEIGYGILEGYRGQGYAAEAVDAAVHWALRQPGVTRVEAETEPDNRASRRVLEKCGFRPAGTVGEEGPRFFRVMEDAMVELKPITEENFLDAFDLNLAPEQEVFVSHPVRSLAQAYVYRDQCQPFGICSDGKMVGYVMVIYDYDIPEYDIWHMMIDRSMQGRGYGSAALDRVIDYIRTKPLGTSDRVALTCHKDNLAARKLYERKGFAATGVEYEDEIELVLTLREAE